MMYDRKPLVSAEVDKPIAAIKGTRNSARDRCLLLLMFRHGLRVLEACGFRLSQVDIESRVLSVVWLIQDYLGHRQVPGDQPGTV
jgi:integrase